jgi:hypothetical protein
MKREAVQQRAAHFDLARARGRRGDARPLPHVADAQKLKGVEAENAKLKQLLADAMLDNAALKDLLGKNGDARTSARSRRAS